jgi:hypothetical protein
MRCLIWERADGGITVEHPAFGDIARTSSDEELIAMCQRKTQIRLTLKYGGPATCHELDADLLPGAYFFNAYHWDGAAVVVDMTKARVIHMAEIRRVRNAELAKLDVPFMQAMESSNQGALKQISTRKQYLRDLPADLDLTTDITTASQLQAKWPTGLAKAISQE